MREKHQRDARTFILIIVLSFSLIFPVYANSNLLNYGFGVHVTEKEISARVDTHILVTDLQTGKSLSSGSTALGALPIVVRGKTTVRFRMACVALNEFGEIGLTPDKGKTRYPAKVVSREGYVSEVEITGDWPLGLNTFEWYGAHYENERIIRIFIFSFVSKVQGKVTGGIYVHIVDPPDEGIVWEQMSLAAKRSYVHGTLSTAGWSNDPKLIEKEANIVNNYGRLLIQADSGSIIQLNFGDGKLQEVTMPENGMYIVPSFIPVGTPVKARYRTIGETRWPVDTTIRHGDNQILIYGFGQLRIQKSTSNWEMIQVEYQFPNGMSDRTSVQMKGSSISYPEAMEGLKVRASRDGKSWSEFVNIQRNTTATINL